MDVRTSSDGIFVMPLQSTSMALNEQVAGQMACTNLSLSQRYPQFMASLL